MRIWKSDKVSSCVQTKFSFSDTIVPTNIVDTNRMCGV
jgi:hypothetical protein